jgi:hypothetical protein
MAADWRPTPPQIVFAVVFILAIITAILIGNAFDL